MGWRGCIPWFRFLSSRRDGCIHRNGRNIVSRVLFQRRELTVPHWVWGQTRWVLRKTRWVRVCTQIIGSRAAKRGCFKRGGFPIWTCPSFFVLFWDFPDFSGIFPICLGMVRGFSRLVLFLFLGLLRAPTRNSPERVRDTSGPFPKKWETPGFGNPPVRKAHWARCLKLYSPKPYSARFRRRSGRRTCVFHGRHCKFPRILSVPGEIGPPIAR